MTEMFTEDDLFIDEKLAPYEDDGNKDRLTHIINPPLNTHIWQDGMTAEEIVYIARMTGQELVALCGHKFVPIHDPEKYDACKSCLDIAAHIMRELGE